jgi:hypothetical protein
MPWNDVGPDGANYLARALPSCGRLTSINLCECSLQAEGASHIAASLHKVGDVFCLIAENGLFCVVARPWLMFDVFLCFIM